MALLAKITEDLNKSLKGKDKMATSILRFLIAQVHNAKIKKGEDLEDEEVLAEIAKEVQSLKR